MKIAIAGYGNLGKGVEFAVCAAPDMELVGIFTRRAPETIKTASGAPVYPLSDAVKMRNEIDVMILCGGSATDLPKITPELAASFNVVDSFDTHADIPAHFAAVDASARKSGKTAVISVGWDPGMFSVNRLYSSCILPEGKNYTFWGKGVSQGHSDAVRRIEGVIDARQYTIPVDSALEAVRSGEQPDFATNQMHLRECYVVAEAGADKARIEREIKEMPKYFSDYNTTVHFISPEEMERDHAGLPHGGSVLRGGKTAGGATHTIEYTLKLDSNSEFTGSVMTAFARAAFRLNQSGDKGCKTIFDIPPALLSPLTADQLRAQML